MSVETPSEVDLLIVGAGPTGLFAAYYAGFREMSIAIVDSLPEAGGQVTAMYPEKQIFDVAGFPSIIGRDLVARLVEQADQFKPTYLLGRKARTVTSSADGGFDVGLDDGAVIRASAILITAGMGEFTPRPLPAGEGWFGRGVVNFVPSLEEHRDQDVVVVGGGDSAFDWALSLHPIARSVTLVHRRNKFRAFAATVRQVRELGVPIITDAQVVSVRGEERVAEVELAVASDPSPVVLPAQTVVAALGFTADLGPIESWGLEIVRRAVAVDTTMRTARDRIYAAGDIAAYPGKVKLIATGFGEAATAVNNIAVALNPEAHLFPGHSSDVS
ncbi:NAD(P)/FAD-dependent oxidoreductase [Actinophytocola sp.]|jgi:ferredoxin/flavodoxin---NADP+ reductase|uniref:NAD(P)/FAD-dependent oxidoreductase n=1 Tax=Actinophytocola sp. TaxID=1872138 RepID=UPI002D3A2398|nr:NAD(P)/FAD-dependent oxidoreductase [Actinophytocola sp.]HYQ62985.1 NAD(P)/FAD-dependent oxidoreductase [Actinophytocola sp.]